MNIVNQLPTELKDEVLSRLHNALQRRLSKSIEKEIYIRLWRKSFVRYYKALSKSKRSQ